MNKNNKALCILVLFLSFLYDCVLCLEVTQATVQQNATPLFPAQANGMQKAALHPTRWVSAPPPGKWARLPAGPPGPHAAPAGDGHRVCM